jgi:hypothetical protein
MVGGADHFGSSGVPLVVSPSCGDAESKKGLFTRVNIVRFTMSKVLGASAGGHFNFARTGHYNLAPIYTFRIIYIMSNHDLG